MENNTKRPDHKKKKKQEWVRFINGLVQNHPVKTNKHPVMALCKNFYKGEQYKWLDPKTGRVVDVATSRETRCIYNFIRVFINTWAAKMIAGNPQPQGKPHPHNTERFDRDVAHVANALMMSWWRREKMRNKLGKLVKWAGKTGIGVWKLYYKPDDKRTLEPGVLKEFGLPEDVLGEGGGALQSGTVKLDVINSMHYYPDSVAIEDPDRRYVLHTIPVARDVAEEVFDRRFSADEKSDLQADIANTTDVADNYDMSDDLEGTDIVIVKDFELMPSKLYPRGKHMMVVNEEMVVDEDAVEDGEDPAEYELSYYTFRVNREDDEYFGKGHVYPLLTLQRDYNKSQSMVMENAEASGVNKLVVKDNAVAPEDINDSPWSTLRVKGDDSWSSAVGHLQAQPYPNYIVSNPDAIHQKAMMIINLNPVDFSLIPPHGSQTSGTVVQELKESSKIAFSEEINDLKMIIGDVCMRYLRLVQLYYSREQIQEIIGENFGPKIDKFLEAKIAPEALDIDIQVGLGFDESPAAKVEKVTALVQNKIFTPLEAKKAMRDYGNIDALIENTFLDEAQAERNLDRVLASQPADISLWANHMAHMKVFTDFVKTPEWEELDPEIKKKIDGYIETLMGHMQAQQAMQNNPGAEQGTGKGAGQPGPQPQPPNLMAQNQAEGNLHLAQGQPTAPGPNIGA